MIRRYLLAGLFTLLPLVVTVWLLKVIFTGLVELTRPPLTWASQRLGLPVPPFWELAVLSALATLLLLFLVGVLVGNILGRQLLAWMDELMLHFAAHCGWPKAAHLSHVAAEQKRRVTQEWATEAG